MIINNWLISRQGQTCIALSSLFCLGVISYYFPVFLVAPFILGAIPLILYQGFVNPAFFALIFLIFTLYRVQEIIPVLLYFKIPLIFALLSILSLSVKVLQKKIELYWSKEHTYFTVFFLWVTFSVVLSHSFEIGFEYWFNVFVKIAICFFLISWTIRDERDYSGFICLSMSCGLILATLALYNKYYGIGLIEGTRASIGFKGGMATDPNDLAFILLIPFSFSMAVLFSKSLFKGMKFLGVLCALVIFGGIIVTQSRGGLLGLLAVLIYFFSRRLKSKIVLVVLGCAALVLLYYAAGIEHRIIGGDMISSETIDQSSLQRIEGWKAAFNMALHHPIFGVGLDQFMINFDRYSLGAPYTNMEVHSSWFGVLSESGFIGFALFLLCVFMSFKATILSIKRLKVMDDEGGVLLGFGYGLQASLIGYCVSSSFLTQGFTWFFYVLFALTVSLLHCTEKLNYNTKMDNDVSSSYFTQGFAWFFYVLFVLTISLSQCTEKLNFNTYEQS